MCLPIFCYKPNFGRNVIVLAAENRDKWASIHIVWVYIYIGVCIGANPISSTPWLLLKRMPFVVDCGISNSKPQPADGTVHFWQDWEGHNLDILPPLCFTKNSNCWFINIQPFKSMDVHPKWPMLYNREK